MIVYGIKAKELLKETLLDKCPNCGTQNSVDLYIFQRYFHIFWLPVIPVGKTAVSQCSNCKQTLKLKEMPEALKLSYDNVKTKTKTPVWMFSGLALILVIIIVGISEARMKDEKNSKLILSPQKGDIFEIKISSSRYTLYKVDEVSGDSVFVRINNYETNLSSGMDELKRKGDNEYSEDEMSISKSGLKKMLDDGEIMNVDRK
ncbi:MAG: zinc-ribbon domain-containing protein [Ferruginibacter sp.]